MQKRNRRALSRRGGLAPRLSAAVILAVGIGVGAALFTLYWDVLARPLPYARQDELVTIWASDPERDVPRLEISLDDLAAIRGVPALRGAAACSAANFGVVVRGTGEPVQLQANVVSEGFLRLLGVGAAAGRTFTSAEHRPGADAVAMVSYGAWRRLFGGDPSLVGRKLLVDGQPAVVVGVLPPHVDLPQGAEILFPFEPNSSDADSRAQRVLMGVARLAPGATAEIAATQVGARVHALEERRPGGLPSLRAVAFPLVGEVMGRNRPAILALLAMSGLVLLTAAANACGILLHRGIGRRQEIAMRRALGARRRDLLRLFAREAAALASGAALTGAALAALLLGRFAALAPAGFPRLAEVRLGPETVGFALGAALLCTVAFTALPFVAQRQRRSTTVLLRAGAHQASLDRGSVGGLDALVVGQVAMALTLAVTAALAGGYYRSLRAIEPGFATRGVLTAHVPLGYTFGQEPAKPRQQLRELMARLETLPDVAAAGSVLMRPLEMEQGWDFTFTAEGQTVSEQEGNPLANLLSATPGYFPAMGIRLRAGRAFDERDTSDTTAVALLGESLARRLWGSSEAALGKRLKSGKVDSEKPWLTVVGVVADVRYRALTVEKQDLYLPYTQTQWSPNYLVVRSRSGNAESLLPEVRRLVAAVYPEAPLSRPRTTEELVDAKLAQPRLDAVVLALFTVTALLLAGLGIYAVLSYLVRARHREMGIRLALGAQPRALLLGVLRRTAALLAAGCGLGIALSVAAARLLAAWLPGVDGPPLAQLAVACASVSTLALAVALLPARRAAATDPLASLR
jgi:putative ABC transport system permease protein